MAKLGGGKRVLCIKEDGSFGLWTWEIMKYIGDPRRLRHKGDIVRRQKAEAEVLWTDFTPTESRTLIGVTCFLGKLRVLYFIQASLSDDGMLNASHCEIRLDDPPAMVWNEDTYHRVETLQGGCPTKPAVTGHSYRFQ